MEGESPVRPGDLPATRAIAACLVFAQHLNWAADRVWDRKEIFVQLNPGVAGVALFSCSPAI